MACLCKPSVLTVLFFLFIRLRFRTWLKKPSGLSGSFFGIHGT